MKLSKQSVKLSQQDLNVLASVTPSGMWAVWKDESGWGKPTYTVSHVPTGIAARNKIPSLAAAKELAEAAEGMEMPGVHELGFGVVPKMAEHKAELMPLKDKIFAMAQEGKL